MRGNGDDDNDTERALAGRFASDRGHRVAMRVAARGRPSLEAALPERLFAQQPTSPPSALAFVSMATGPQPAPPSASSSSGARRSRRGIDDVPEPGAVVEKYRLEELLGVGGFGVVYRATHLLLHTVVALKLLKPSVARSRPHLAQLLCDEARMAARIDHPNVVRILDVTRTEAITYVVMEHIEGGTLAEALAEAGPVAPQRALQILIDVAEGLRAGLRLGIVHRDVKPANVLLTATGSAKLVDFGLAALESAGADSAGGLIAGTPGYMAPERRNGGASDFRADIFSLGVTIYHILSGVSPLNKAPAGSEGAPHKYIARPLREVAPSVNAAVAALVMSMVDDDPSNRPSTYEALVTRARALMGPS